MAKKVFQAINVFDMNNKVFIAPPKVERPKLEMEEEFIGPTPEEIEEENRHRIEEAEEEARHIIDEAKKEAERIVKDAETGSFDYVRNATEKAKKIDEDAKIKIDKFKIEQEEAFNKEMQTKKQVHEKEYQETKEKAHNEGYQSGYNNGKSEVDRLISRLHTIIEGSIDKRDTIIEDAEIQVIRIILLITRKVVKSISEEQKGVVVDNIRSAMDKIKGKTEVIIRVNTEDLELTTEHKEELMQRFEELRHVTILEDTRVDKGGCIVETDFGSVDARIATQLQEVEEKIRNLANLSYFDVPKVVNTKKVKQPRRTEEPKLREEPKVEIEQEEVEEEPVQQEVPIEEEVQEEPVSETEEPLPVE